MSTATQETSKKWLFAAIFFFCFIFVLIAIVLKQPEKSPAFLKDITKDIVETRIGDNGKTIGDMLNSASEPSSTYHKPQMTAAEIAKRNAEIAKKSDNEEEAEIAVDSTGIDISLMERNEEILKEQLARASKEDVTIEDAAYVARNADEMATRVAAINAVSQHDSFESSYTLREIFDESNSEAVHREVLRNISSQSLNSEESLWMTEKMFSEDVHERVKYEISKKLIIAGMIENPGDYSFYEGLVASMPIETQDYFDQHFEMLKSSGR